MTFFYSAGALHLAIFDFSDSYGPKSILRNFHWATLGDKDLIQRVWWFPSLSVESVEIFFFVRKYQLHLYIEKIFEIS